MSGQVAVLFLDEDERVCEFATDQADDPTRMLDAEVYALPGLKAEGWIIEGPFQMRQEFAETPKV